MQNLLSISWSTIFTNQWRLSSCRSSGLPMRASRLLGYPCRSFASRWPWVWPPGYCSENWSASLARLQSGKIQTRQAYCTSELGADDRRSTLVRDRFHHVSVYRVAGIRRSIRAGSRENRHSASFTAIRLDWCGFAHRIWPPIRALNGCFTVAGHRLRRRRCPNFSNRRVSKPSRIHKFDCLLKRRGLKSCYPRSISQFR